VVPIFVSAHGLKVEADISAIYRILSVALLHNFSHPKQSFAAPLFLQLYFKPFLSSRPKNIQQNTIEIHRLNMPSRKFTTTYSDMRGNSKARISGLAASTHV